jgi:hypothetical protein
MLAVSFCPGIPLGFQLVESPQLEELLPVHVKLAPMLLLIERMVVIRNKNTGNGFMALKFIG